MNILIVDDHPTNRKLLCALLEAEGYMVQSAQDGSEALAILEREDSKIEAVISDILMPKMDGYRLCHEVRKNPKFHRLAFIFYTATYTSAADEKLSLDIGANAFLRKPTSAQVIVETLEKVTQGFQPPISEVRDGEDVLKEYSERLVQKLEEKNQELQATQQALQQLLAHSPAVIFSLKPIEGILAPLIVNDTLLHFLGYTAAELQSPDWWVSHLHPDDSQRVLDNVYQTMQGGERTIEYRICHKDGSYKWVEESKRLIRDHDGRPDRISGIWLDITQRKEAEERLRNSEERFSKAFRSSPIAKIITSAETSVCIDANESFQELVGYQREEVIGYTPFELKIIPDMSVVSTIREALREHGHIHNYEVEIQRKSGEARQVLFSTDVIQVGGEPHNLTAMIDITERKRAQAALRKSEQKFSVIFEKAAFAGALSRLSNGLIVNVNEEFERVFGYTKEEVIGRTSLELGLNPDSEWRAWLTAELQARGLVRNQELTLVTKSGVPRLFLLNLDLVEIGGENYVLQTAQDITERRHAEAALRESEQRLKRAQEIAHLGSWDLNLINNQLTWSDEAYRIFGLQPQEFDVTYQAFLDAVHPEDRAGVDAAYSSSIREGRDSYEIEHRVVRRSTGEIRIVHEKCEHFRDQEGQIIRSIGMVHDITERKRAEEEITNLAKFPTENPHPMLRVQADGQLTYANASSQDLLEDWNCGVNDYLPQELRDFIAVAMDDHLNKTVDVFCRDKVYSIMLVPIVEGGYVNIYGRDITERKRAEDALKHLAEDLRRSNAELEQFAYVASHDLQEPLRMVSSYMQLLKRRYQGKLDNDADEFIAFAVDGSARMQQLINDLLTFSRVGTRGRPMGLSSCEKALAEALINLQVAVEESQAIITHDPLPTVFCDQPQLVQVFQNLIGNSIKFRGRQAPQIHISAKRAESEWIFSVCDNGIGLEPKFEERIFEIFQRLHSRAAYPGTGIGLAICKRIVVRHGGRIWVESKPGEGATFYFTLPVKETS